MNLEPYWLVWGIPLFVGFISPFIARVSRKLVGIISSIGLVVSFLLSLKMLLDMVNGVINTPLDAELEWLNLKDITGGIVGFGVLLDSLSLFMITVITFVSMLIFIFSIGYMAEEEDIGRYWFWMNIFVSAMLLLVLSDNLIQLFITWEIVGICSWALISFWYKSKAPSPEPGFETEGDYNAHCGFKALVTTGFADVFFLVAILMIGWATWATYGHPVFNFMELGEDISWAGELARYALLPIFVLFILSGPFGKSAQFPYHEWLPEAMAGPTTVSALIHAATMVKAGVYFVARFFPIMLAMADTFPEAKLFFLIVAVNGAFTAFLAGTQGMVARELKKVLAYSTISQIGYMFLALGVGGLIAEHAVAFTIALMHLSAHAVFKALLFLSAASVLHSVGTKYLDEMGALKKYMPITYVSMLVGAFALSGVPIFSGFFTKDEIVKIAYESSNMIVYLLAVVTVAITAFYSFRMIGLVFFGKESDYIRERIREGHEPHESPSVMTVPLLILAGVSTVLGFMLPWMYKVFDNPGFWIRLEGEYVEFCLIEFFKSLASVTSLVTLLLLVIGIYPAYHYYIASKGSPAKLVEGNVVLRALYKFLKERWFINKVYYKVFRDGLLWFANKLRKIQTGISNVNLLYAAIGMIASVLIIVLLL